MSPTKSPRPDGSLTALYYHNAVTEQENTLRAAQPFVGAGTDPASIRYFSSWGRFLKPVAGYRPCGHYLTPLNSSFKRAVVLRSTIPLPSSKSLAAVFGTMLSRMGEGSELFIESPRFLIASKNWVTAEHLAEFLPSCTIEDRPGRQKGWIRVGWSPTIDNDLELLDCTYPRLASHLDGFYRCLEQSDYSYADPLVDYGDSIENAFSYCMHWALHTRSALEVIFEKYGIRGPLRVIDIGGSYGFLACELASAGHHVINLEELQYRIHQVLPWLIETTGVQGRVEGMAERMENLEGEAESVDIVSFMGSLLYIDRADVEGVLATAARLLKPGGLIVLRENLLLPQNDDPSIHRQERFTAPELHAYLQRVNKEVTYVCNLGHTRTYKEVKSAWTIFAAVEKQCVESHAGLRSQAEGMWKGAPR